jgi:serine/threonine protein kinase
MKCKYCGTDNPPSAAACQNCNQPLDQTVAEDDATVVQGTSEFNELLFNSPSFNRRYKVLQLLGEGGMGKVYKAWDKELEEEVAVKVLLPQFSSEAQMLVRFKREIKLARSITHENVCKIFDLGEAEGTKYITMEFIEGQSLESLLKKQRKLNIADGVRIINQITDALVTFHKKGIIHRDLKPSNIMINPEGKVYIMDFGIAKSVESDELTRTGDSVGTPAYMAPEQIAGEKVDSRADLYSLGVIIYQMFTGQRVFEADTPYTLALKQLKDQPQRPREINPQLPESIEKIILKCLKKNPEERYQSAVEIINDFKKASSVFQTATLDLKETAPTEDLKILTRKAPAAGGKKIAIISATIAVIAVGILFLYFQLTKKESEAPLLDKKMAQPMPLTDMILIPAGDFTMGSSVEKDIEEGNPQRTVHLKAFYIDKYEVTNTHYKAYIDATGAAPPPTWPEGRVPPGKDNHPVVGITWEEASAYARWAGKRLPTEEEWEKAARGTDGRMYPWGDSFEPQFANVCRDNASPVDSFPEDKSPYDVFNMAGNVREWTATRAQVKDKASNELQEKIIIRGGSWGPQLPSDNARCSNRGFMPLGPSQQRFTVLGFRCAKDAEK